MPETFGTRLRRRREEQQISLAAIAEDTKIKVSLLDALEHDDVSRWPGGIFRRAYMKAYARAIHMDPAPLVREFSELFPDPDEQAANDPVVAALESSGSHPTGLRALVGSAFGSLSRGRGAVPTIAPPRQPEVRSSRAEVQKPEVRLKPDTTRNVAPAQPAVDLDAVARLCTRLGQLPTPDETAPVLREACALLGAVGAVVWIADSDHLLPAIAHGYSPQLVNRLPRLPRTADNATAAAFRSESACVVAGSDTANGAVAVPLLGPAGCAGVLAIEVRAGSERLEPVRTAASIIAAQLSRVIGTFSAVDMAARRLA